MKKVTSSPTTAPSAVAPPSPAPAPVAAQGSAQTPGQGVPARWQHAASLAKRQRLADPSNRSQLAPRSASPGNTPVCVKSLGPGLVHVAIKGDGDLLKRMGINDINSRGPKDIQYVSLDPEKFTGRVVGNDQMIEHRKLGPMMFRVKMLKDEVGKNADAHVFVNGSFFNKDQKANPQEPAHTLIGESRVLDHAAPGSPQTRPLRSLPIAEGYESDYVRHEFADGSMLTTAPELVRDGKVNFTEAKSADPKYQWDSSHPFKPGGLKHASHANSRIGLVLPGQPKERVEQPRAEDRPAQGAGMSAKSDRVRLYAALIDGKPGQDANGLTLPEAARLAHKLSGMNATPGGRALNMDGGASSQLVVMQKQMEASGRATWKRQVDAAQSERPQAANFVVYSRKPPQA